MNENIDLTKILKDCPKGTEFYSSVLGEVEFEEIRDGDKEEFPPIIIKPYKRDYTDGFTKEGFYFANTGECTLFPSREQRDWSKFSAPWYKKLVEPKFKVGDKIVNGFMKYMGAPVTQGTILKITDDEYIFTDSSRMSISSQDSWELVSDKKPKFDPKTLQPFDKVLVRDDGSWEWKVNFYSHKIEGAFPFKCVSNAYICCIPYNDETKHLVGTTEDAPEYYRYWED